MRRPARREDAVEVAASSSGPDEGDSRRAMPPCSATRRRDGRIGRRISGTRSIGNSATACSSMRPAQRSRISAKTGQEIASCGGSELSGCGRRGAVGVGAAQAEIHARARTSLGGPARLAVARRPPRARRAKVPSGLAVRGQIWPLSMWVCRSTRQGQTIRPWSGTRPGPSAAGSCASTGLEATAFQHEIKQQQLVAVRRRQPGGRCQQAGAARGPGRGSSGPRARAARGPSALPLAARPCLASGRPPGESRRPAERRYAVAPEQITLRRPDDWHLHLRDGAMLAAVAAVHGAPVRAAPSSCRTWCRR